MMLGQTEPVREEELEMDSTIHSEEVALRVEG